MKAYIKVFLPLLLVFIFSGCLANELNTSNAVNNQTSSKSEENFKVPLLNEEGDLRENKEYSESDFRAYSIFDRKYNPKVKEKEIEYLLNEINSYFEKAIKKEDILSSWSGIRPLIKSDIEETQAINREHAIFTSNSNLVSIAGGKWTTTRKMAEDLLDYLVKNEMLEKKESCQTQNFKLDANHQTKELLKNLSSFYPISKETKESLITLYGDNAIKILTMADERKSFDLLEIGRAHV